MPQNNEINYNGSTHNGDNNFVPLTPLEQAISEIIKQLGRSSDAVDIIDDLADFITDHPSREIIGLEGKLMNGNRQDLCGRAVLLKNKFERKVAKQQMSITEQHVYVQILSKISTVWHEIVKPQIDAGVSRDTIDSLIHSQINEPVHKAIVKYDVGATSESVAGMLYYLTGKCHIVWAQEC
jgi:hypothetical protein